MYVTKVTNGPVGEGDGEWAVTGGLMKEGKEGSIANSMI